MHRTDYRATLADSPTSGRREELDAIRQLMDLLKAADAPGAPARCAAVLAYNLNAIWSALLVDLADPANDLPPAMKASLISIGIHVIKMADAIGRGLKPDLPGLREIHQSIADGLT